MRSLAQSNEFNKLQYLFSHKIIYEQNNTIAPQKKIQVIKTTLKTAT